MRVCERCRKYLYPNSTKSWYCARCKVSSCKCMQAHRGAAPHRASVHGGLRIREPTDLCTALVWCHGLLTIVWQSDAPLPLCPRRLLP